MDLLAIALVAMLLSGDAATLLGEKDLERDATTWVLPSEAEFGRALRDVRTFDRSVKTAKRDSARRAKNMKDRDREKIALGRLKVLRSTLEQRFPEVEEFDRFVERRRAHA